MILSVGFLLKEQGHLHFYLSILTYNPLLPRVFNSQASARCMQLSAACLTSASVAKSSAQLSHALEGSLHSSVIPNQEISVTLTRCSTSMIGMIFLRLVSFMPLYKKYAFDFRRLFSIVICSRFILQ